MKHIPFRDFEPVPERGIGPIRTREVIQLVADHAGERGVTALEMRKRCRILAALDAADAHGLRLEDADHEFLKQLVNDFRFAVAHPNLLRIIDDVNEAGPPP